MIINNYPFWGNLVLLILLIPLIIFLMLKKLKVNLPSFLIWVFILFSWIIFQLFLNNLKINDQVSFLQNWYAFPLFTCIFQITQVFSRIPLGLLAKKLNSRKIVVLITIFCFGISLGIILISSFSLWSIFLGVISSGITGSIFGMKNQQFSHVWNAQKVFSSSTIVFFVPLISKVFAQVINSFARLQNISNFNFLIATLILTIFGFVGFSFLPKSTEKPFLIKKTKENKFLNERSFKDIIFLSLSFSLVAGLTFFVFSFNDLYGLNHFEKNLIMLSSILGSVFLSFLLLKKVSVEKIRFYSLLLTIIIFILMGLLVSLELMNKWIWMVLFLLACFCFGIYNILLFASALHLDNNNIFLVFSFLLTLNSLLMGLSQFLGSILLNKYKDSNLIEGLLIITFSVLVFAVCQMFFISFKRKKLTFTNKNFFVLKNLLQKSKQSELK